MAALIAGERDPSKLADLARDADARQDRAAGGSVRRAAVGPSTTTTGSCCRGCWPGSTRSTPTSPPSTPRSRRSSPLSVTRWPGSMRSPGSGRPPPRIIIAEIGIDMTRFPTAGASVLLGQVRSRDQVQRREEQGQRIDRARQPLPGPRPRRSRRHGRPHQHLPRRPLPTDRPTTRQEEGHRRRRPIHPGHHLAPALRPRHPLPRPRRRPLRPTTSRPPPSAAATSDASKPSATNVTLEPAA